MTTLIIHCNREQVKDLVVLFTKLHHTNGRITSIVPNWLKRMYQAAKTEEYRRLWYGGNRMITHDSWHPYQITKRK
jgi:hypothetical protein